MLKVDGILFGFVLSDSFQKPLVPVFQPMRNYEEPVATRSYTFSRGLYRLQMTSSFDWFTGLAVCFVIGQNDSFHLLLVSQQLIENCSYHQLICNSITMTTTVIVTDHQEHNQPGGGVTP